MRLGHQRRDCRCRPATSSSGRRRGRATGLRVSDLQHQAPRIEDDRVRFRQHRIWAAHAPSNGSQALPDSASLPALPLLGSSACRSVAKFRPQTASVSMLRAVQRHPPLPSSPPPSVPSAIAGSHLVLPLLCSCGYEATTGRRPGHAAPRRLGKRTAHLALLLRARGCQ